jgi:hypothetical protein
MRRCAPCAPSSFAASSKVNRADRIPAKPRRKTMNEDSMTKEEFLASRKAAGRVIDVETCKIAWWYAQIVDPYEIESDLPDEAYCVGSICFVVSPESDGPVCVCDLPEDKVRALYARIDRANQTPTTAEGVRDVLLEEYARAVAKLDEVIDDLVDDRFSGVPSDLVRSGVRLALAELGKEGTPQQVRLERKFRRLEQESRAKPRLEDRDDLPF